MTTKRQKYMEEYEKTRAIIKDFADKGLYSVNCEEVKYLYKRLRELECIIDDIDYKEAEEKSNYEPYFIDGSDVPISGRYE